MVDSAQEQGRPTGPWDYLLLELHALRRNAGDPSYSAIGRRISEQRMSVGATEHAARMATSSVHDAFRLGRRRINVELTREIVEALRADPSIVDEWIARSSETARPSVPDELPADSLPTPSVPQPAQVAVLLAGCLALNLLGREFVDFFHFPIYLDMVGTAIAAVALGPWRAVGVGVATNVIGIIGSGWISLPFALVQIAGALVWGYGVHKWGLGRTLPRFFGLNVLVALACSMVAVPVIVLFLGEELRFGHDVITQLVEQSVDQYVTALAFSNLLTTLGDKLTSGFVALVVVTALPAAFRCHTDMFPGASAGPAGGQQ